MNSKSPLGFRSLFLLAVALVGTVLSACSVDMSSKTETTGTFIGPQTLAQIEPGKSRDFVVALIGPPTKMDKVSDGDEIWKWVYVEKHIANGNAFLMNGTASNTENTHTTFVEFKNGLVDKAWKD